MNKRRLIFAVLASLTIAILFVTWSSRQAQGKTAEVVWTPVTLTAADFLDVRADGTLGMKPEAESQLSTEDFAELTASLADGNKQILAKGIAAFTPNDERLKVTGDFLQSSAGNLKAALGGVCYCSRGCCTWAGTCCTFAIFGWCLNGRLCAPR